MTFSLVEQVLISSDQSCLALGYNTVAPVRLEPVMLLAAAAATARFFVRLCRC